MPGDVSAFFDERLQTEMLYRTLHPYLLYGFKQGMLQAKTREKAAKEDEFDAVVQSRLRRKSLFHASLAVGTTKDEMQKLLSEAVAEGQSVQQLAGRINDYFKVNSRKRSLVIARTEMTDTINDGTLHVLQREGYARKEWITNLDGRERAAHRAANGQVVGMHEPFTVGGELAMSPGDDSLSPGNRCNCRCRIVAAGLPDDRKAALSRAFLHTHGSLERMLVVALAREFDLTRRRVLAHFPSQ